MTLEVDFLPFATAAGADVESQADWAADPAVQTGMVVGIAQPAQFNKAWRQGNFFAAMLAQFIATVQNANVLDDGNLTGKVAQMWQALLAAGYFIDGGTTNAILIANPSIPAGALTFVAPQAGTRCSIKIADTNSGAATIDWMGVNTSGILTAAGSALAGGELVGARLVDFEYDGTHWQIMSQAGNISAPHGQCYLGYVSATQLELVPKNGCNIIIAGLQYQMPAAGITLSNSGLSNSTAYYIYLYNNSGTLTLLASTTSHSTDTTAGNVGIEIMTGNNAYTLVGATVTNGSGQFQSQGITSSWFNRVNVTLTGAQVIATTTAGALVELASSGRVYYWQWASDGGVFNLGGTLQNTTPTNTAQTGIIFDGSSSSPENVGTSYAGFGTTTAFPGSISWSVSLGEGYHYATPAGGIGNAGTCSATVTLSCTVRG